MSSSRYYSTEQPIETTKKGDSLSPEKFFFTEENGREICDANLLAKQSMPSHILFKIRRKTKKLPNKTCQVRIQSVDMQNKITNVENNPDLLKINRSKRPRSNNNESFSSFGPRYRDDRNKKTTKGEEYFSNRQLCIRFRRYRRLLPNDEQNIGFIMIIIIIIYCNFFL